MSASVRPELFTEPARSWDVLDQQRDHVRDSVARLDAADLNARPIESIVDELCSRYSLDVPVLHEDAAAARHEETDVLVGRRALGPARIVRGSRIAIAVPFTGDRKLFELRPDTYEDLPTPRGTLEGNSVVFSTEGERLLAEEVRADYDSWLRLINRHLDAHREKLGGFNEQLRPFASAAIEERIARLREHAELLSKLGLPVAA